MTTTRIPQKTAEDLARGDKFVLDGIRRTFDYATASDNPAWCVIHYTSPGGNTYNRRVRRNHVFDLCP